MPLVIVTKQCYLVCEKITFITLEECLSESTEKKQKQWFSKKVQPKTQWIITIDYVPEVAPNIRSGNYNPDNNAVEIKSFNKKEAFHLYKEIVEEIRDQCPDIMFLDKLVEKALVDFIEDDNAE